MASIQRTSNERFREKLLKEGILALDGSGVVFSRDYLFSSPSMAATVCKAAPPMAGQSGKTPKAER